MRRKICFCIAIALLYVSVTCGTMRSRVFLTQKGKHCTSTSESLTAVSEIDCSRVCLEKDECTLVSYNPPSNTCELSEASAEDSAVLVPEAGWNVHVKQDPACLPDWLSSDHSCYYLDTQTKTYEDAEIYCSSFGAHLVDIKTSDESHFVTEWLLDIGLTNSVWLGCKYDTVTNQYVWTDGTTFSDGYQYWASGEPNEESEHCVAAYQPYTFQWVDISCEVVGLLTMCEYSLI